MSLALEFKPSNPDNADPLSVAKSAELQIAFVGTMHIDDNIVTKTLADFGQAFRIVKYEDAAQLGAAQSGTASDLIVCAAEDAEQVLAAIAGSRADIPCIAILDCMDFETAIKLMRSGVRDTAAANTPDHVDLVLKRELETLIQRRWLEQMLGTVENGKAGPRTEEVAVGSDAALDFTSVVVERSDFSRSLRRWLKEPESSRRNGYVFYVTTDDDEPSSEASEHFSVIWQKLAESLQDDRLGDTLLAPIADDAVVVFIVPEARQAGLDIGQMMGERLHMTCKRLGQEQAMPKWRLGMVKLSDKDHYPSAVIEKAKLDSAPRKLADSANGSMPQSQTASPGKRDPGWEARILAALKNDRFTFAFQPIVNLCGEPGIRYELLLRMLDNQGQKILPTQFLPWANLAGLLPAIDRWVIKHAVLKLAEDEQSPYSNFFVKLSAHALGDTAILSWIKQNIDAKEVDAGRLCFCVKEFSLIDNNRTAQSFLEGLNALGCKVSIEQATDVSFSRDFSTQHTFDYVKLDRSIVAQIPCDRSVVDKLIAMTAIAHGSGKKIIAEFVQDAKTLRLLWECQIDYIQGYYVQAPQAQRNFDFSDTMG